MILIIADDPVAREVYGELFVMRGHEVITAAGAREGLKLARDRRIAVAVLAVPSGAAQLRRKLHALRPMLRVHVTGLMALPFDVVSSMPRQQLH
jgi:DNA-binding response OmpR family regulator